MLCLPVLAALPALLVSQTPARPYVRVHDQECRSVPASSRVQHLAAPASAGVCNTYATGQHGEAVPGGGTLDPFAGGNPATISGASAAPARAAFVSQVSSALRNQGVFVHDGTTLFPIAMGCGGLGGSGVPSSGCGDPTPVGGTFGGFFTGTVFAPAVNESGDVLFLAEVQGGSAPRGLFLYRSSSGSLTRVAAVGDPSPAGGTFAMVGPGSLNDLGDVVFLASGTTAGPSDVFLWRAGVVTTIAKVGDLAPGGGSYQFLGTESLGFVDGTTIPIGPLPDINDQGVVVMRAIVSGGSVSRGLLRSQLGANPSWLVVAGDPTPAGGSYLDFQAATLNESGEYAFFADFQPTPGSFNSAWFAGSPGSWRTGLAFLDPVAGGQCVGLAFSRNPMSPLDDLGNLLLWTDVQFPAGNSKEHLVLRARDGTLAIVARKGETTPIGGTYSGFDAWPSLDRHGRGALGAFTPGAPGGVSTAHFVVEACPVASASTRNGGGTNSPCFAAAPPILGSSWHALVDVRAHPGAVLTLILGHERPLGGRALGFGELLFDPGSTRQFRSLAAPGAGFALHGGLVPSDPALAGLRSYMQAALLGGGTELCNAVDVVLGY